MLLTSHLFALRMVELYPTNALLSKTEKEQKEKERERAGGGRRDTEERGRRDGGWERERMIEENREKE